MSEPTTPDCPFCRHPSVVPGTFCPGCGNIAPKETVRAPWGMMLLVSIPLWALLIWGVVRIFE